MDELYDWQKEETQSWANPTPTARPIVPITPNIRLQPIYYQDPVVPYHPAGCRCFGCEPEVYLHRRDPDRPANTSPLLDKVVALVVAFAAMIVGGMVLLPLLIPLLGMLALMMIIVVAGLAVLLGIVKAVTGSNREPVREVVRRRRWR